MNQVIRKLKANTAIDRPFGLLVARAKAGDIEFFTPPPTSPSLDPATVKPDRLDDVDLQADDAATDEAIGALSAAEIEALDAEIAADLSPATLARLRDRPAQLTRLRRAAWRRQGESVREEP